MNRNQDVWRDELLYNTTVKKIILIREDELAVYVSMKRAEETGSYMTRKYPKGLKIRIDIPKFQAFVNHYKYTFQRKYRSPLQTQDSFRISYEQIVDKENFERQVAPLLFKFLGVDHTIEPERLKEVVCQSGEEPLHNVISNFDEVEFAFRHTNLSYLRKIDSEPFLSSGMNPLDRTVKLGINQPVTASWSILLPICSRTVTQSLDKFNIKKSNKNMCWKHLESFAESLLQTTTAENRARTECIVGIDLDDNLFNTPEAKQKIVIMLPCKVTFVTIHKPLYGKVCKIWNKLADQAKHDFIVLLGDDVVLMDEGWQDSIEAKFREIAELNSLPFGAASVAFNDLSFEGFPTFPVVHRWHFRTFNSVLPRQFINQGGDPYLFELYSRWNASAFVKGARVKNTLGGDGDARYVKRDINWKGQVLRVSLDKLGVSLGHQKAHCIDVVIPSYRIRNIDIMTKIVSLRASRPAYVKFWIIIDNPDPTHLDDMKKLASKMNHSNPTINYFVNVVHYGENKGASYARNVGYNYSNADWVLFLDDDVVPSDHILDAYMGAIMRYPSAKVMVGNTEMPNTFNLWTRILRTSNIMFFYGVAKHRINPPWGVTANLMVKGSRHNHTVQFKTLYPKTGGGEDIDFVLQMKKYHGDHNCVVSVPGANAQHPWWNKGFICYRQICGWAIGKYQCNNNNSF